ncbi:MAG: ribonuclease P protein component [bacterium]|nr:ribonuclease P protein component [bacterium]
MLAQKNRFHGHGSLRYVYANGESIRTQKIVVKFTRNPFRKDSRFAVVISKKVLKSAVGRNRVRRRVYEIIRRELPRFDGTFDVAVMIFHKSVKEMPHEELRAALVDIFKEADFYCNK